VGCARDKPPLMFLIKFVGASKNRLGLPVSANRIHLLEMLTAGKENGFSPNEFNALRSIHVSPMRRNFMVYLKQFGQG
jgi:hypothetical protein